MIYFDCVLVKQSCSHGDDAVFSERAVCYSLNHSDDYLDSYYTFAPYPLCRDVALTIDDEFIGIFTNTHRFIGLLEGLCRSISIGIMKLLRSQTRNRSYYYADFLEAVSFKVRSITFTNDTMTGNRAYQGIFIYGSA
jgi:hypothetical protein